MQPEKQQLLLRREKRMRLELLQLNIRKQTKAGQQTVKKLLQKMYLIARQLMFA